MGDASKIEWTEATWNPVTGCTKVSAGCKNCYAETMANRLHEMAKATGRPNGYHNGFKLTLQPERLEQPLQWKRPRLIFVNSMSDLFHTDVPDDYIRQVWDVMVRANWHTYQVLTKRSDRLSHLGARLPRGGPVWVGVSVEDQRVVRRIDHLRDVPKSVAAVRFLSLEPLIGPLQNLNLTGIDWVIVGGESGPGARPMDLDWARDLRDQCQRAGVPFFFKQIGGVNKKVAGRLLDGRTWDEMPELSGMAR